MDEISHFARLFDKFLLRMHDRKFPGKINIQASNHFIYLTKN